MKVVYTCFPQGKHKCLTMSYDDGRTEDVRLIELLNRYGIKGTFHLNSGRMLHDERLIGANDIAALYKGHEVACHTVTHPTIARCPMPSVINQVMEDRRALEAIVGYPVRGLSYPNGSHNAQIREMLPFTGVCYSRVVGDTFGFDIPEDFMAWKATCHHSHQLMECADRFTSIDKSQNQYLMYVWGHSYEFTQDYNWDHIEAFCQKVGGRDDIWYATNIQIYDYMQVFSRLQFAADNHFVYNPSAASAWIRVDDGSPIEISGGTLVSL